jgi:type III secretion protein U
MSEKTEKPTPRRLREARKRGEVARSTELTRALVLVGCVVWLGVGVAGVTESLMMLLRTAVSDTQLHASHAPQAALSLLAPSLLSLLLPPLVMALVFGLLGDFLQVRGLFSLEPLIPKLENLDPASGFGRMFSWRSVVHVLASMLMVLLLVVTAGLMLKGALQDLANLTDRSNWQAAAYAGGLLFKLVAAGAVIHLLVGVLDLVYQHHDFLKRQRMSIDEVRRELKENEGDPHMRSARLSIARDAS